MLVLLIEMVFTREVRWIVFVRYEWRKKKAVAKERENEPKSGTAEEDVLTAGH